MDNALRGLASGVQVIAGDGQPGSGTRVRVRGIGTINNSDPLYIVDGMPISGGIDNINPADIESIEVLKMQLLVQFMVHVLQTVWYW